jgi:hypothetical protein
MGDANYVSMIEVYTNIKYLEEVDLKNICIHNEINKYVESSPYYVLCMYINI